MDGPKNHGLCLFLSSYGNKMKNEWLVNALFDFHYCITEGKKGQYMT